MAVDRYACPRPDCSRLARVHCTFRSCTWLRCLCGFVWEPTSGHWFLLK